MAVECFHTRKGYSLGLNIDQLRAAWYWTGRIWRKLIRADYDAEWFCDDYEMGVAETSDILSNWVQYLPGVVEWDYYGDFTITFDMGDVEDARWDEARLVNVLETMANAVRVKQKLAATDAPYLYETTDAYGSEYSYWRHPALKPLHGMIDKDYPTDMDTTGDRRP